jgi:hypothetical protein
MYIASQNENGISSLTVIANVRQMTIFPMVGEAVNGTLAS